MSEISLSRNDAVSAAMDYVNREALVVADAGALQLVEPGESAGRDRVELALDPVARPGEVDKVGDSVGSANERVGVLGGVGA